MLYNIILDLRIPDEHLFTYICTFNKGLDYGI